MADVTNPDSFEPPNWVGTVVGPPVLPLEDLPPGVWEALQVRQERLPLHRFRSGHHVLALLWAEERAARRLARRERLEGQEARSLVAHHVRAVGGRILTATTDGVTDLSCARRRAPDLLYPLSLWTRNQRTSLLATWFGI
jgi:hypothetical protein